MELQVNNTICEAVGCFEKATTKVNVKVGNLGSVSLDLCIDCVGKFDKNDNISGNVDLQQKIARNGNRERNYMEAFEK
jgi:hypothetical protein